MRRRVEHPSGESKGGRTSNGRRTETGKVTTTVPLGPEILRRDPDVTVTKQVRAYPFNTSERKPETC